MKAHVEYTDLFCGESNYSWVRRVEFDCDNLTDLQIVRRAKQLLGISGLSSNSNKDWTGEDIARYFKSTVMFITFEY